MRPRLGSVGDMAEAGLNRRYGRGWARGRRRAGKPLRALFGKVSVPNARSVESKDGDSVGPLKSAGGGDGCEGSIHAGAGEGAGTAAKSPTSTARQRKLAKQQTVEKQNWLNGRP
eukprot:282685-Pyramimonas_sp.AAC.1